LGGFGSKGAIFFHCASVSNGPDRAIRPPSALLTLLISYFQKLNHHHFNGLSTVVQQLLVSANVFANSLMPRTFSLFSLFNARIWDSVSIKPITLKTWPLGLSGLAGVVWWA
jgi:hypothetical protein